MDTTWSTERTNFILAGIAGGILGWILGFPGFGMAAGFAGYGFWLLRQIQSIDDWVASGSKTQEAPDVLGGCAQVVQHLHREHKKNQKRKKRLKYLLGWYNASASAFPDATLVVRPNGEILWGNKPCESLLGIDPDRDTGLRIDNLWRSPEFIQFFRHIKRKETQEVELMSPLSGDITLLVRAIPYRKNMLLVTARDISQRVKIRQTQKNFVDNVSHELRTPLTVIHGYMEMLEPIADMPADIQMPMRAIRQQSQRMLDLVEDLLTLSKLENNQLLPHEGEAVDVGNLLSGLKEDLKHIQSPNAPEIQLNVESQYQLRAIPSEIASICTNLLKNAIVHNPPDTAIHVSWQRQEDGSGVLCVRDEGAGIAPEHLPRITERFYRIDESRVRKKGASGTGLGLSIIKHSLQRHGGHVEVHSELRKGTQIRCQFPAERVCQHVRFPDSASDNAA